MSNLSKSALVRVSPEMHKKIKIQAAEEGKSIRVWMTELVIEKLSKPITAKKKSSQKCQKCGDWDLNATKMARLGTCDQCGKKEIAVFPVYLND